ncbi:lysozyme inhibitor LprI family protein [Bradyrhizobium sp. SYSU BS000235]|uniref:lysozyme inhibitor LprI family protein n=1 Tax=Bradyrhizobium sp. SYSU BS000235 TaxID=3411332 RepID=UPI003C736A8F
MIRRLAFGLLSALCLLASHAARAEGPDPRDIKTITACLQSFDKGIAPQEAYEACVRKIASPCMNDDEDGVPPAQQIECFNREQAVWDKILNDSYKTMMDGLEPEQQQKLRAMQRSWIQTRDLSCAFYYDYFQGSMANPMMASCDNRETARRAIYLRIFAQDMSPRK